MAIYLLQRISLAVLICALAMVVLFGMIYVIPGDPASVALGPRATPAMKEALRASMGLDRALPVQLFNYFSAVVTGDLGQDVWTRRSVSGIIAKALPQTLVLILAGLGGAALIGVPLGCFSAVRRNSWIDKLAAVVSVGAISIPSFVVAVYLLLLFAVILKWFPAIGAGRPGNLPDQLWHLVLPAIALGFGWVGYLSRIVRASMLEVMGEDHIRTAKAFGLPERRIVMNYALRIAIVPTITVLGLAFGSLLSGAVFTEIVFSRPGIGRLVYDAVLARNYPVVQGVVLSTVILFVTANLLADLTIAWLDPRVRARL